MSETIVLQATFDLGTVVATPGALAALDKNGQKPAEYLRRHAKRDWGEALCDEDKALNEQALIDGSRLMSAYNLPDEDKLWIITEAAGENSKRSVTTLLLPEEY